MGSPKTNGPSGPLKFNNLRQWSRDWRGNLVRGWKGRKCTIFWRKGGGYGFRWMNEKDSFWSQDRFDTEAAAMEAMAKQFS